MDLVSLCPLRVASTVWQRKGQRALTVVCKGTFKLTPGELTLADEQEPILKQDLHHGNEPTRSLRVAGELAPIKQRFDVVLIGSAFAPNAELVRSLVVRLSLAGLRKSFEVYGDRFVDAQGVLSPAEAFASLPLVYERAAGGEGTSNPVGLSPEQRDSWGRTRIPNLLALGAQLGGPHARLEPVGFGPIAAAWPGRREKLSARTATAAGATFALEDDLEAGFFNVAPLDQQLDHLPEDAQLELENLHPEVPLLKARMPRLQPQAVFEGGSGSELVPLRWDTLLIDTDQQLCTVLWRGHVRAEREGGRIVVSLDERLTTLTLSLQAIDEATSLPPERTPQPSLPFPAPSQPPPKPSAPTVQPPARLPAVPLAPLAMQPPRQPMQPPLAPLALQPPLPPAQAPLAPPAMPSQPALQPTALQPPARFGAVLQPVPVSPPSHAGSAGSQGLRAASDAAADPVGRPVARVAELPESTLQADEVLQLLWFAEAQMPRLRRKPAFRPLLAALDERPLDAEVDDPALAASPALVEDRREVSELLLRGAVCNEEQLEQALGRGVREGHKFAALLELFEGELSFPFDDLERLKLTMATVAPFVTPADEALRTALQTSKDFLALTAPSSTNPMAEGLSKRLRDTYHASPRPTAAGYVETQVERALLEQRHYQRRLLHGAKQLRAVLGQGAHAAPVYLPEELAFQLPLHPRFKARLIAEVHPRVDHLESHAVSLKAVALAWIFRTPSSKARR
jgi:hypothetical protein